MNLLFVQRLPTEMSWSGATPVINYSKKLNYHYKNLFILYEMDICCWGNNSSMQYTILHYLLSYLSNTLLLFFSALPNWWYSSFASTYFLRICRKLMESIEYMYSIYLLMIKNFNKLISSILFYIICRCELKSKIIDLNRDANALKGLNSWRYCCRAWISMSEHC